MTYWNNSDVDFDASYDYSATVDIDYSAVVDFTSDVSVNHDYNVDVCIDGNEAVFSIDVQAYGDDSATELNLVVFVNDDYSSITATGWAAVA
ncbi:hypothetical protein [Paracoccus sp. IB05]|uniref:hypothetical protein n=1 Tax=Paracoccus sp. IB05 TaxID=2779367 RepID=UPI0018E7D503|nr:hypothetical protein [Paracoccus sp. IB05]MBJ2150823.1 hypothetical protein [Paracoccus sp. IB05]